MAETVCFIEHINVTYITHDFYVIEFCNYQLNIHFITHTYGNLSGLQCGRREIAETMMHRISCDRSPTTLPVQKDVHQLPIRHSITSTTENETNYSI
jgi:hypothetical protein